MFFQLKISEIKAKYLEDLQAQIIAHKSSMTAMKTALEKNKILELEMQLENHKKEIGKP